MKDNGKKKLVWAILFSVITIVLCYLFIVVYFYFISPYNIALRLTFWPFVSENQVGQMYNEATVDVIYPYIDEDITEKTKSVSGVNISQDGYIVLPYSEIADCVNNDGIRIYTRSGSNYKGRILYVEEEFNLCVIKCVSEVDNGSVNIPFVTLTSNYSTDQKIIVSSPSFDDNSVWTGYIEDCEGYTLISNESIFYCAEDCFLINIRGNFYGGAVFDKNAHLLGFSYSDSLAYDEKLSDDKQHYVIPTYPLSLVLDDLKEFYKEKKSTDELYVNELVEKFIGVDSAEIKVLASPDNLVDGRVKFGEKKYELTDDLENFILGGDGFYLFEKFIHNDIEVPGDVIVTSFTVNGKNYAISDKLDMFLLAYNLKKGDRVTVGFKKLNGSIYDTNSESFTV